MKWVPVSVAVNRSSTGALPDKNDSSETSFIFDGVDLQYIPDMSLGLGLSPVGASAL